MNYEVRMRINRVLMLLAASIFISCEKEGVSYISPLLELYVKEFAIQSVAHGRPTGVEDFAFIIDDLPNGKAGHCDQEEKLVIIDLQYYDEIKDDPWAMELVVFHECGHCLLNRDHTDEEVFPEIPASIMHRRGPEWLRDYPEMREGLLKELFEN